MGHIPHLLDLPQQFFINVDLLFRNFFDSDAISLVDAYGGEDFGLDGVGGGDGGAGAA